MILPTTITDDRVSKVSEIPRHLLTEQFLMGLPEGIFLVSNFMKKDSTTPIFLERVSPQAARKKQWKRIYRSMASKKSCIVFDTAQALEDFMECLRKRPE